MRQRLIVLDAELESQMKHRRDHEDPCGWFQCYCRYYPGRRCPDDERQIKRRQTFRRHVAKVKKHCRCRDLSCRPKQRQALLQ